MTVSSTLALRKAVLARLSGDTALTTRLGGAKIFDETPRGVDPPYVVFVDGSMRDWSGQDAPGAEHMLALSVISIGRGVSEGLDIGARIVELLDDAPLALDGHSLVDLRHVASETRRDQSGRFSRVNLRFRATTEPAA